MRFLPPVAALADGPVASTAIRPPTAARWARPLDALRALGVDVDDGGRGALPFTVLGAAGSAAERSPSMPRRPRSSSRPFSSPEPASRTGSSSITTVSLCRASRTSR